MKNRRSGFTLVEILVVLGIIAILAALLFPAFGRARESGRQTSCASNLSQIYLAVTQYKQDEGRYPRTLVDLLPEGAQFDNGTPTGGTLDGKAAGYYKGGQDGLLCPDDDTQITVPRSSYGPLTTTSPAILVPAPVSPAPAFAEDPAKYAWNYWGYQNDGYAYPTDTDASTGEATICPTAPCTDLLNSSVPYDKNSNPLKYSLSNRFAPASTIITHCMYHRLPTANNINSPIELYAKPEDSNSARDIVLRLDGSAKALDVTQWGPPAAYPTQWQRQTQ